MNEAMRRLLSFVIVTACAASTQAAEPSVHLLSMGQAPQAPLQTSDADAVRSLALVVETRVSMKVGAMTIPDARLPTVALNLAWHVSAGETELVIESVDVRAEDGANAVVADELRRVTATLVGKVVRTAAAVSAASESPVVAQTVAELRGVLAHLLVPMPVEPVGVNAQWEVIRTVERRGVKAVERAVYELVERDGQTIRVKLALDVGANPQKLSAGKRLTQLEGTGTGDIVLRLDQPGPVDGTIALTRTLKLREGEQELVLNTETTVRLSSL